MAPGQCRRVLSDLTDTGVHAGPMTTSRRARTAVATVLSVTAALGTAATAHADPLQYVSTWAEVVPSVTHEQTVWALTKTAGLGLHSTTGIEAEACQGQPGYIVTALYGQRATKEVSVNEQPAKSCADTGYTWYGPVRSFTIDKATIEISAQCGWNAARNRPVAGFTATSTCSPASVQSTGGLIHLTQTASTKAKSRSVVWITTTGLTYGQLVTMAKGLTPVY